MEKVKVYQIGVGSFGRYGFEKLVDMHNHLTEADVELVGICEKDFEKAEKAEKFAEENGIELESFRKTEEMYNHADSQDGDVLIYDAGPTKNHATHIYDSMQRNFFHLAEKPPSLTREQFLKEKRLAQDRAVMWKVDFIERESPVVQKACKLVNGKNIDTIRAFRESSVGIQKVLDPVARKGVVGGDILDKMVHEAYLPDLLKASAGETGELEVKRAEGLFMPKSLESDSFMTLTGSKCNEITESTATAQTEALVESGETSIELYSSWIGFSDAVENTLENHDFDLAKRSFEDVNDTCFRNEECRFFIVEGEVNLLGDLLNRRLYNLEDGSEIETPDLLHDQLYRVIRKAVLSVAGERDVGPAETEEFMEAIFDIRDNVMEEHGEFYSELDTAQRIMNEKVVEDKKVLEPEESEKIAG